VHFLAAAQDQIISQSETPALLGEGTPVDQLRPGFGERAFAKRGKIPVQLARQYELQNGIAQKLEPLVVLDRNALLVGNGGMRQRQSQQLRIPEMVAQLGLEIAWVSHKSAKGWALITAAAINGLPRSHRV
jgi:hypothetical protein